MPMQTPVLSVNHRTFYFEIIHREIVLFFKQLLVHQLCPTRQALRFLGCSVVIEVSWLQWVLPRYLHQVGLGCFLQLGQNMAATAQWRAVHLEHLGSERRKTPFFSVVEETGELAKVPGCHFSLYLKTNHLFSGLNALKSSQNSTENLTKLAQGFPTLKPSSWAQAYTEAVLPTPGGPVMRTVLHSGRPPSPSASVSPRKSPQSHTSYGIYSQRNCVQGFFIFWSIKNCLFKTWKKGHTAAIFSFLFLRCSRLVTDSFLFPFLQPAARQNDFFFFTEFKSKLRMKIKGNVTFAVFSQRQHCRWLHLNSEGCICQSIEESPKWHLKNRRINKKIQLGIGAIFHYNTFLSGFQSAPFQRLCGGDKCLLSSDIFSFYLL